MTDSINWEWTFDDQFVIERLREQCERIGLREFCRLHKLDSGNVSNILSGKRVLQPKVAEALGFHRVTAWESTSDPYKK